MRSKALFVIVIAVLSGYIFAGGALAAESKFRKSFRTSYEQNRFDAMGFLVKQNKDIMPGEIQSLVDEAEVAAIGLSPVIFPHWVHRINFECKACHPVLFPMKKTNSITMTPIFEGRLCGECHNGKIAFDAAESCERGHVAGRPGESAPLNPKKADIAKVMESSERLKTELNLDLLPNKALPL